MITSNCTDEKGNAVSSGEGTLINIPIDTVQKADTAITRKEFGKRFSLTGDFDGDEITDTVYESYTSKLTNKETDKILDNQDVLNNIELIYKNETVTRLYTTIANVDTFIVIDKGGQTGLFHFRNLGDINNDGKDEIGYAIKWVDFSKLNTA